MKNINLKSRPSVAKTISEAISKKPTKVEANQEKDGVDLIKLTKTLSKRHLDNLAEEQEKE